MEITDLTYVEDSDFVGTKPADKWDFKTAETSLFACIP